MSLAHYGCEGPPLDPCACSTAFAIHGVLVPRDNLEPEVESCPECVSGTNFNASWHERVSGMCF
eukprot:2328278-Rhodomonas_salina.1